MRRTPRWTAFALALLGACSKATPGDADGGTPAAPIGSASVRPASTSVAGAPIGETTGPAADLRAATLASSRALETVQSLSDEVGPRLSGSAGNRAAVPWAVRTLEAAGLSKVHTEPVKVPHWERGAESGELTQPFAQRIALTALGGSVGTPASGLEAEVVEASSIDELDKLAPPSVAGKIVFVDVKTDRERDGAGYGRSVPVRYAAANHAAKLGAAGVVIRSIGTDDNRLPHTGMMAYEDGVKKIPAAALSVPDAEMLHRIVAKGQTARLKMTLGCKTLPDADSANVVGDVPGASVPEEIVLLGAHLDSWDLGTGAIDDGAGCGIVIEAARQIASLARRPRRTVRVVLFANEENGLAGAKAYAKTHEAELERHVLAMEADTGAGRVYAIGFLGPESARPAFARLVRVAQPLGIDEKADDAEGGADLSPLRPFGVPLVDLHQDASMYFDFHHTANDTPDKIKKDDIDEATAAYAAVTFAAADLAEAFGRVPEEKRKSKRY